MRHTRPNGAPVSPGSMACTDVRQQAEPVAPRVGTTTAKKWQQIRAKRGWCPAAFKILHRYGAAKGQKHLPIDVHRQRGSKWTETNQSNANEKRKGTTCGT